MFSFIEKFHESSNRMMMIMLAEDVSSSRVNPLKLMTFGFWKNFTKKTWRRKLKEKFFLFPKFLEQNNKISMWQL